MLLTCVFAESEMALTLENSKVAVSATPFGGPPGVQLPAAFQSPLVGLESQVAEPPEASLKLSVSPNARWRRDKPVVLALGGGTLFMRGVFGRAGSRFK